MIKHDELRLPNRVLVTGATGFLGNRLATSLAARGIGVRGTGRNLEAGLTLEAAGVEFHPVDLRDRQAVIASCADMQAVVHCGALSAPWGTRKEFFDANVVGTQNIADGCEQHNVRKLIYISSPSVLSRHEHQYNLDEAALPPSRFVSLYSESKFQGEGIVSAVRGADYVILRPKAIYGAGDSTLIPRILDACRRGRLPIVGSDRTTVQLTHVDDVVDAIINALARAEVRNCTYHIAGAEVRIWDVIRRFLDELTIPHPKRHWSVPRAMRLAGALEWLWRTLKLPGEPPITRYAVGILAYDQTYDTTRAARELGFAPRVPLDVGFSEVVDEYTSLASKKHGELRATARSSDTDNDMGPIDDLSPLVCRIMNSGVVNVYEKLFRPGGKLQKISVPAMFAAFEHPDRGVVLFDTGYTPRFYEGTKNWPYRLYRYATPVEVARNETAIAQLDALGIQPEDVRAIVLSHFDPDHYGGLRDFPQARIFCSWRAWHSVAGKTGVSALMRHILPGHFPADLTARLHLLPDFEGARVGPLGSTFDLFGDDTMRLVQLPGHAPGHLGALVRDGKGRLIFLVADAVWSADSIESHCTGVHHWLAHDKPECDASISAISQFANIREDVVMVPSHCPSTATLLDVPWPGKQLESGSR